MNGIKITKLSIENFRGIEWMERKLHPNMNVVIGENGTGKSSLLDSLAITNSWFMARAKSARNTGLLIQPEEITNGKSGAVIDVKFAMGESAGSFTLSRKRPGANVRETLLFEDVTRYGEQLRSRVALAGDTSSLPLFAYYPVSRMVDEIPIRIKPNLRFPQSELYTETALGAAVSFRLFFEWFRWRNDMNRPEDSHLACLQQAISTVMPGYTNFQYQRNPLRLTIEKQGVTLRVDQLSYGEKMLLGLIGDMVRRLSIANPSALNPLEGDGVVLIDEVDLHLHANWQRQLATSLVTLFPNTQFFLATCSSHIAQTLSNDQLIYMVQDEAGMHAAAVIEDEVMVVDEVIEEISLEADVEQQVEKPKRTASKPTAVAKASKKGSTSSKDGATIKPKEGKTSKKVGSK